MSSYNNNEKKGLLVSFSGTNNSYNTLSATTSSLGLATRPTSINLKRRGRFYFYSSIKKRIYGGFNQFGDDTEYNIFL